MNNDALKNWVQVPAYDAPFWVAMENVRSCDIVVYALYPHLLEEIPDLPDRIRGALGRSLERTNLPDAPALWHAMFGDPPIIAECNYVRGFIIRCDRHRGLISVTLRLFGVLCNFCDTLVETLKGACEFGIALRSMGQQKRKIIVQHCCVFWRKGFAQADIWNQHRTQKNDIILKFITPVYLRGKQGKYLAGNPLAKTVINKACGMARWWGVKASQPDLKLFEVGRTHDVDLAPSTWTHRSSRTGPGGLFRSGVLGKIELHSVNLNALAIFQLAELIHLGGGGAAGLGRISAIPSPSRVFA